MSVKKDYPRLRQQGARYYYDHGGKPRKWEPLGKDWREALRRYYELEGVSKAQENTVEWLIGKFMESRFGLRDNTMKSYRRSVVMLNAVFKNYQLDEIDRGMLYEFMDKCRAEKKAQSGRNAATLLIMAYNFAVERQIIDVSPLAGMKFKVKKAERERYLTDAEFLAIREKLKPVYQVAVDLAYLLGLRVSGVVSLKFSHIKDGVLSFQPPKSKKPITYQLTDEVKNVIERARTLPGSVRGLTVICNRSGKPMSEITVSRAFSEGAKKAGIEDVRFHDIRAKSASDEAPTAQGRLGHSDARTTDGYLRKPQVVFPIRGLK